MKNVWPLIYNNSSAITGFAWFALLFVCLAFFSPRSTIISCVYVSSCLQLSRPSDISLTCSHLLSFWDILALYSRLTSSILCSPWSFNCLSLLTVGLPGEDTQSTLICYVNYKHFPHWCLGTHVLFFLQKDNIIHREPKTASEAGTIAVVVRITIISKQSCTQHPD